ncbi:MAG: 5'/3'-nucleotidase SurE [Acidobacteria bacterium]|nr:MAG: 5'/3'-nucleotidase SurE [Acidobacteriota bacterium]
MQEPLPPILVTNDDGIAAPGLQVLAQALAAVGKVTIIAPDREQSASSHALTLHRPLRVNRQRDGVYSVDGTPTDCINLGILNLLAHRPRLVVSGINRGVNLGDDITYSGTVAAAFEGTLLGVPSFAISQQVNGEDPDFFVAARFAVLLARWILQVPLPAGTLLNVNVPQRKPHGTRLTRQGRRTYHQGVVERTDPSGRQYYWLGGIPPEWDESPGSDFAAIREGFVSLTPLHLDLTHYPLLQDLQESGLNLHLED